MHVSVCVTCRCDAVCGVDHVQEIVGLGLANFAGSAFNAYSTTGSFSRSAVNYDSGGHMQPQPPPVATGLFQTFKLKGHLALLYWPHVWDAYDMADSSALAYQTCISSHVTACAQALDTSMPGRQAHALRQGTPPRQSCYAEAGE